MLPLTSSSCELSSFSGSSHGAPPLSASWPLAALVVFSQCCCGWVEVSRPRGGDVEGRHLVDIGDEVAGWWTETGQIKRFQRVVESFKSSWWRAQAPDERGGGVFVGGNELLPVLADVNLLVVAAVVTLAVLVAAAVVLLWLTEERGEKEAPMS